MANLLKRYFLAILVLVFLMGCSNAEESETMDLEQTGILANWKFEKRFVNNIANLAVECCDYIEFSDDSHDNDLKGSFTSRGTGYETFGTFEINTASQVITFHFNDNQLIYWYDLQGDRLTFDFEENGQEVEEVWIRVE